MLFYRTDEDVVSVPASSAGGGRVRRQRDPARTADGQVLTRGTSGRSPGCSVATSAIGGVLELPDAIRKMTGRAGSPTRDSSIVGRIAVGIVADLVLFDPAQRGRQGDLRAARERARPGSARDGQRHARPRRRRDRGEPAGDSAPPDMSQHPPKPAPGRRARASITSPTPSRRCRHRSNSSCRRAGVTEATSSIDRYGRSQATMAGFLEAAAADPGVELHTARPRRPEPDGDDHRRGVRTPRRADDRRARRAGAVGRRAARAARRRCFRRHQLDADGEIIARVRRLVGEAVPIGVTLDMHANVSSRMIELPTFSTPT